MNMSTATQPSEQNPYIYDAILSIFEQYNHQIILAIPSQKELVDSIIKINTLARTRTQDGEFNLTGSIKRLIRQNNIEDALFLIERASQYSPKEDIRAKTSLVGLALVKESESYGILSAQQANNYRQTFTQRIPETIKWIYN